MTLCNHCMNYNGFQEALPPKWQSERWSWSLWRCNGREVQLLMDLSSPCRALKLHQYLCYGREWHYWVVVHEWSALLMSHILLALFRKKEKNSRFCQHTKQQWCLLSKSFAFEDFARVKNISDMIDLFWESIIWHLFW